MWTIKGFTLIEVIIAFTIAIFGLAFIYSSLGFITVNLLSERKEDKGLSEYTTALYYSKAQEDFLVLEHISMKNEENTITCQVIEDASKLILTVCPYIITKNIIFPEVYRIKIREEWILIPR